MGQGNNAGGRRVGQGNNAGNRRVGQGNNAGNRRVGQVIMLETGGWSRFCYTNKETS